ncbi:MAG: formate-dependent phosphoribosylglycinamide formyltransferase [Burkholderiales bacterium]|jgi:phosphoribosylglycinamide formyltransferase 2|nr:formate-dependent phosphoribosylglycinamide formyltransferase [Burkholderiales bacterium]
MYIGTPLSAVSTKVMLLGGGELGKEVVIALQRLGVETIVVDRYVNPPAAQVAHRSYCITMTDAQALLTLIEKEKPHIIVPEIEAIATSVLLEVEQRGLAQIIPNARAVNLTMNRALIRRLASEELGLNTSKYKFAKSLNQLEQAIEQDIGYPAFVKPIMSSSGKGQSKISNFSEIGPAWKYAQDAGRVNQMEVIVESAIHFDYEITLLTVRSLADDNSVITSICNPIGHKQIAGDYVESFQPQIMGPVAHDKAIHIAKTVTNNLGGLGVFGVELFIKGDEVWFSEVSPRPHDTGLVTLITQYQNEFELHARAILGLPVNVQLREHGASHVIYAGVNSTSIKYDNLKQALNTVNTDIRLFGKPEGFVKRRMGIVLAAATTVNQALEIVRKMAKTIKIET